MRLQILRVTVFDRDRPADYNDGPYCEHTGPVAQLGARVNGIHEVTGSNPVWSTNSLVVLPAKCVCCDF